MFFTIQIVKLGPGRFFFNLEEENESIKAVVNSCVEITVDMAESIRLMCQAREGGLQ